MTVNSQHAPLIGWFQQQQTPPGWFDLLTIMIDGMVRNVGQVESQPFLRQMGKPWPHSSRCRPLKPWASWRRISMRNCAILAGALSILMPVTPA